MIAEETNRLKVKLVEALTDRYSRERSDIHVSDLVGCLRKSVYKRLQPAALSETTLMLFMLGEEHHQSIQSLASTKMAAVEKHVEYDGIVGTVDVVDLSVPVEIKTRRTKDREPDPHHVKQLSYYMAMMRSNIGILFYVMLNNLEVEEPKFIERTFTFTDSELDLLELELMDRRGTLEYAATSKEPSVAPQEGDDRECGLCPYIQVCKSVSSTDTKV